MIAAGFGFDPKNFAPTYRLNYGSPGSSLAFEIATRLGLPASIIERARAHRSERESQLAEHLAKLQRDVQTLDHERRLVARERETLGDATSKLHARERKRPLPRCCGHRELPCCGGVRQWAAGIVVPVGDGLNRNT